MKTNRLFHMEQKLVVLCVASVMLTGGAELLYGQNNQCNSPALPLQRNEEAVETIILATENMEVSRLVNLGLQDTLLGYDSLARVRFHQALQQEPNAALALCGLMLLEYHNHAEYSQLLNQLTNIINSAEYMATPQEIFYVETFLKLISGDVKGAATDFEQRSELYRADILSGCWAIALRHAAHEESAIPMAKELYERNPKHPLCAFLYCQGYESRQEIPTDILKLSLMSAEKLERHPMALHLAAHLHFRSNDLGTAEKLLHEEHSVLTQQLNAYAIPPEDAYELIRADLYLSTVLQNENTLCKQTLKRESIARADILYRWEVMTLPMRALILRSTVPSAKEVRKAAQCNVPHETFLDDQLAYHFGECLKSVLQVRVLHHSKRREKALDVLQKAEHHYEQLRDSRSQFSQKSMTYLMCYRRALDCAEMSLAFARALLYKDSSSIWNEKLEQGLKNPLQLRMLPPMLFRDK